MVLETPELSYVSATESKRKFCVATIRRDARTGTVRVTAAGEDKAVNLFSVTMSAAEVMSVVSEKVGGRRGKELVAPIVMEGGYAAIRRVQEARRKEILQVFVESLKLDIYQHELAIGKLFLIRRSAELKSRLLESLWHQDAIIGRSSGRGTEIFRQFRRLGTGWAAVAVYETWGDLFFEAYDPTTTSTMTLETSVREVLGSLLPSDRAAAAAYLLAVRTGTFPRKLMRQVLNRLDVILPGESGRWWRRPIDGESPHLALLSAGAPHSAAGDSRNACQQYRGPVWTEERFSSGKAVTARVLVSARGDYLVEMEARDAKKQKQRLGSGSEEETGRAAKLGQSHAPSRAPSCSATSGRGVLRLEVKAQELRSVLRAVDRERRQQQSEEGPERKGMENLLAPDRRAELCRYLLDHIALEDLRPSTTAPAGNDDTSSKGLGVVAAGNVGIEVELRAVYKSYKAWAAAVKAPVDRDPLRGNLQQQHPPGLSPSYFVLVLRPDIDKDEHLLPIHESPWTPDGKTWFQAKVSLLQGAPAAPAPGAAMTAVGPRGGHTNGETGRGADLLPRGRDHPYSSAGEGSKPLKSEELGEGGGLSVTLRPEGAGQRRARLEREANAAMAREDDTSRLVGRGVSRLDKEATGRAAAVEEARRSSSLAAAVFTTRTRNQNRIEALLRQEQAQAKTWAEQDLASARQAAGEILPLLRLEAHPHEGGEQRTLPLLRMMDVNTSNDNNRGGKGAPIIRRFHVLHGMEEPTATATPVVRRSLAKTMLGRSFVSQRGREPVAPPGGVKGGTGTAVGTTRDEEVVPVPLRGVYVPRLSEGLGRGLVPSERRYRGEGFLERHGVRSGSGSGSIACVAGVMPRRPNDDSRPTPLVQQVLQLERGCGRVDDKDSNGSSTGTTTTTTRATPVVAVVRAVLEPPAANTCDCDGTAGHEQDDREDCGRQQNEGTCEVRSVVRVEAYLPDSSTTLTLRVKVPPSSSTSSQTTIEGNGTLPTEVQNNEGGEDHATLPLRIKVATSSCVKGGAPAAADAKCKEQQASLHLLADGEVKEECRSRKKRRRACRDARNAEARRGDAEMFTVVQDAAGDISKRTSSHTRWRSGGMDMFEETTDPNEGLDDPPNGDSHHQRQHNNAFSMLLVRANVVVPVRRLNLGSGSWREAIGKLVGCPPGQELRALNVDGPLVFALDSSCPAPFNVKAEKLFGIRVQGDIVWVQARAEERVLALLEADGQLMGEESETVNQLGCDQVGKAKMVEQRRRRGNEAVNKGARRLLPVLSRSFFSASFNPDDAAAAEVRALFDRAWLTRVSEMFDDPSKGTAVETYSANQELLEAPNVSMGSSGVVAQEGGAAAGAAAQGRSGVVAAAAAAAARMKVHPWHLTNALLRMHVLACKIPGPACPVPCCHQSRTRASAELTDHGECGAAVPLSTSISTRQAPGADADVVLLRELDRCIMWYWESKEHKRREARDIEGRGRGHKTAADQAREVKTTAVASDGHGDEENRRQPQERPASPSAASASSASRGGAGGGGAGYRSKVSRVHRPLLSPPSPRRPFERALLALERLTTAAGKPHDGVSAGVSSSSLPSSCPSSRASTAAAADITASLVSPPPSAGSNGVKGAASGKRKRKQPPPEGQSAATAAIGSSAKGDEGGGGEGEREGEETSSSPLPGGAAKCRVGFDVIRLLTGPDGYDAWGRPVGVEPGEDVETAVLGNGGSKVSQWVMNRLKLDVGRRDRQENGPDKAEGNQQYLCLDDTHVSGAVCISGTRFLLTIAQLVNGSISVSGHDPLTCQTAAFTLDLPALKTLCQSEGLQTASTGNPIGSIVATHLMRNAPRLLEVQSVGGVDTMTVAGQNQGDNESIASSTSSGIALPDGYRLESTGGSPRQQVGHTDGGSNGPAHVAGRASNLATLDPKMASIVTAADEAGLVACRIRRLEAGRRRAEGIRRAASVRKLAAVAKEQRDMLRTCDPQALALAKSSFEALLRSLSLQGARTSAVRDGGSTQKTAPVVAAGLDKDGVLVLRGRVVQELSGGSGGSQNRRGSVQVIVDAVRRGSVQLRRGSVQMMAEVNKRAFTRSPVSSPGRSSVGNGTHGTAADTVRPVDAAVAAGSGDKEGEEPQDGSLIAAKAEDQSAIASPPRRTCSERPSVDGAGILSPPNSNDEEGVVLDEPEGVSSGGEDGGAAIGVTAVQQLHEEEPSPPGTAIEEQLSSKQGPKKTLSPRKRGGGGEGGGESPAVTLEELLAAVDVLSQKVEEGGGAGVGVTAYAAWWVGAVSDAELELKRRFLAPSVLRKR
ncbi:unnamed protein product [Ectocarpus fasciculatus]